MGIRTDLSQSNERRVTAARNEIVPGYSNKIVALGTAAVVLGGAFIAKGVIEVAEQPHKQEVEAIQSIDSAYSGKVVIKSGAKLRTSPALEIEKDANVAEQVAENSVLTVTDPAIVERGGDTWVAITKIGSENPASIDDLADNTEWANLSKLSEQGLATVIPNDVQNPYIAIHVNEQGAYVGQDGAQFASVSTASIAQQ